MKLDHKFYGHVLKAKDGSVVPDDEYIVFLAKDNAFAHTLNFYLSECIRLGADERQINAVREMISRMHAWRNANQDKWKVPDIGKDERLLDE